MPGRAIGVQWFAIDRKARTLAVDLKLPPLLRPNSALRIPVKVDGLAAGEEARIVVAAVDVGILNLTNYKPPAPDDYYLGQRRLTAEIRDLYGQLIDGMQGTRGQIRTGGDARRGRDAGHSADAAAARALFRHRHGQARRHRRGGVRHPGLRRHRPRDGGGLEQGQGRPRQSATSSSAIRWCSPRRCRASCSTATAATMHLDIDNVEGQAGRLSARGERARARRHRRCARHRR